MLFDIDMEEGAVADTEESGARASHRNYIN